eukprot:scaffold751_cov395-Prasinococcus_capsulatus_cf.AAC.17
MQPTIPSRFSPLACSASKSTRSEYDPPVVHTLSQIQRRPDGQLASLSRPMVFTAAVAAALPPNRPSTLTCSTPTVL